MDAAARHNRPIGSNLCAADDRWLSGWWCRNTAEDKRLCGDPSFGGVLNLTIDKAVVYSGKAR